MEWQDEAIVLGVRRHGETSVIAEVMTRRHGRHMGLVRSGRSRSMQPVLQPGNEVEVTWRARLIEHLGDFRIEPTRLRAAGLMEKALSVYGVQAVAALLRLLPERDPHPHLYQALGVILDHLDEPAVAGELYVRLELAVLEDLGFGLDLSECAATGGREELVFVSPKSGRAVCRSAGQPYAERLLALPLFLGAEQRPVFHPASAQALADAFRLTGFFMGRNVFEPRGATGGSIRDRFIEIVLAGCESHSASDAAE